MSATATPYGMRPVGVLGGRVNNNAFNSYKIASGYAANVFYGDVVKLVSDGVVEKDTGTATLTPIGVFVGCRFTNPTTKELTLVSIGRRVPWPQTLLRMWLTIRMPCSKSKAMTRSLKRLLATTPLLFKPLAALPSVRARMRWTLPRSTPRTRFRCVLWRLWMARTARSVMRTLM